MSRWIGLDWMWRPLSSPVFAARNKTVCVLRTSGMALQHNALDERTDMDSCQSASSTKIQSKHSGGLARIATELIFISSIPSKYIENFFFLCGLIAICHVSCESKVFRFALFYSTLSEECVFVSVCAGSSDVALADIVCLSKVERIFQIMIFFTFSSVISVFDFVGMVDARVHI